MLRSIRLDDWKSFGTGDAARNVVRCGQLTLLVGANASGKSNVLDALRFLQGAALDLPLYDVLRGRWEGGRETWPPIRGGEAEAARSGCNSFELATTWGESSNAGIHHVIEVSTGRDVSVLNESGKLGPEVYFNTSSDSLGERAGKQDGGAIRIAVKRTGSGKWIPQVLNSARCLLNQIETVPSIHPKVVSTARALRDLLKQVIFFDLQPKMMRQSAPLGAPTLGVSGENLAAVLRSLNPSTLSDLVDWLSELCAPRLEGITFAEVEQVREVFFLLVESGGRQISSRSASDGTLRFLGILTALLTSPEGSLVVFEEPDVGLNPARIHLLAELLEEITARRGIQVIATTHSPTLIAHLSETALRDVVAFDRHPDSGLTICSRVGDLPGFSKLRNSTDRDHLLATGWLERAF